MVLLLLVLFASMMWVTRQTESVTFTAVHEISQFYESGSQAVAADSRAFVQSRAQRILDTNALYTIASFTMFIVSAGIILSNYQIMRKRDEEHTRQLSQVEKKAVTDQLTGVKNRHAYSIKEKDLNNRIEAGGAVPFAIVVCDINDLKLINDRDGHNFGDECIRACCGLICRIYKHSPVYRIGGDEFAVVLERDDYEHRQDLLDEINCRSEELIASVHTTLAVGMSEYQPGTDESVLNVFARADSTMYRRKNEIKDRRV